MQGKYDTTSRQRKVEHRVKTRESFYITTKNLNEAKAIIKWHKQNNSKKGGKSRHIVNF